MSDEQLNFEKAKRALSDLRSEQIGLANAIHAAASAGDAAELIRLKQRQGALPSEIFAAEVIQHKANVTRIKAAVADANRRLIEARSSSKETDQRTVAALQVLDEERQRINGEALAALSAVYGIQNELKWLYDELRAAEQTLTRQLSEAA